MTESFAHNIPVYILCGGKSSRMGRDKGLAMLQEKHFIDHIISGINEVSKEIVLVTQNSEYSRFGLPIVNDHYKDKGPLGGIHAALKHTKQERILILSCDIPLLDASVLKRLIAEKKTADIIFAETATNWHPLIGIYSKRILKNLEAHLEKDQLRLFDFIKTNNYRALNFTEKRAFTNINTPEVLARVEQELN